MKLTEMKSRDIFTSKTTPEDVEKIVFSGDNLSKNQAHNNVAVLLGGPGMIPYRADKGIWLYEEQKVEKVEEKITTNNNLTKLIIALITLVALLLIIFVSAV